MASTMPQAAFAFLTKNCFQTLYSQPSTLHTLAGLSSESKQNAESMSSAEKKQHTSVTVRILTLNQHQRTLTYVSSALTHRAKLEGSVQGVVVQAMKEAPSGSPLMGKDTMTAGSSTCCGQREIKRCATLSVTRCTPLSCSSFFINNEPQKAGTAPTLSFRTRRSCTCRYPHPCGSLWEAPLGNMVMNCKGAFNAMLPRRCGKDVNVCTITSFGCRCIQQGQFQVMNCRGPVSAMPMQAIRAASVVQWANFGRARPPNSYQTRAVEAN
eukprot:1161720-Pelagomonas_calceolata.AAC.3